MIFGFLLYGIVYTGFAFAEDAATIWGLFALYGMYAAATEGVSKAWISDLVPNQQRGLAIGLQTALASLGALVASSWTGAVWSSTGGRTPLLIAALTAILIALALLASGSGRRLRENGSG